MPFKDISYLEHWQPYFLVELNHVCNFGRGYQVVQFCEIILNLDQWLRMRCLLKILLIWSSGGPFFSGWKPFVQFWKMRNNSVKLF